MLHALCHDLNSRVASLYAVTQLVELGGPLPASFALEPQRLEEIAARVALLPGNVEGDPAPFAFDELLRRAELIHARLKDREAAPVEVELSGSLPPVLVNEGRMLRALLLFLDAAAHGGADGLIRVTADEADVEAAFGARDDALDHARLRALDQVLRLEGGGVELVDGRCALTLPALARARADGR